MSSTADIEKLEKETEDNQSTGAVKHGRQSNTSTRWRRIWESLSDHGVELQGVAPVPESSRTDTAFNKIFTVWFTSLLCPLSLSTGILGTLVFDMSLRDTSLLIVFFSLLMCIPPAYIQTIAPQTGMRQMIQSRYSFGMFPNAVIVLLNLASLSGYHIICLVIAGQTLAAVSDNTISIVVGIVVVALLSLAVSLPGFRFIHQWQRWAWIPAAIAIVVAVGCGGSELHKQKAAPPPGVSTVFSFISLIAGYMLPYGAVVGDIAVYMPANSPKIRIFTYCWMGICIPSILLLLVGAAVGGAVNNIASWSEAYEQNSVGGIMTAMLGPSGGFGKFLAVILALSVVQQISIGFYSVSFNFQIISQQLVRIPRFVFIIIITAIDIAVAQKAAESFFESLENFLAIIAYWSAAYTGIIITEWLIFRHANARNMSPEIWNSAKQLPYGIAALASLALPFALVVPSMSTGWYVGPIAKTTGDLGFEFALVLSVLLYIPLRHLEIRAQDKK
ncbi:putative purine-cytosine permease FCY2 [Xylariaceae sp. FL1019]|nr:putative purine-cytosine permease FCY2 [Xylariaceae sp. FL1019]